MRRFSIFTLAALFISVIQTNSAFSRGSKHNTVLSGGLSAAPKIHSGYDLTLLTLGLHTNRKIQPYGAFDSDTLDSLREAYLENNKSPSFDKLRRYFDQAFPDGMSLSENDPRYLAPTALRDFEGTSGRDGLPPKITIQQATAAIDQLIQYAEEGEGSSQQNSSFILANRYYLKRVLVFLETHPDKTNDAIVLLASVGLHCRTERTAGLRLLENIFYQGDSVQLRSPINLQEHVGYALDRLREQIFRQAVAFVGPGVEPSHTSLYYRRRTYEFLHINPGFPDPGRHAQSSYYRVISLNKFVERFFEGKKGVRSSRSGAEQRRSHLGYTPQTIARTVIDYLNETPQALGYEQLINFFMPHLTISEVDTWTTSHQDKLLKLYLVDDMESPTERQEFLDEIPFQVKGMALINGSYLDRLKEGDTLRDAEKIRLSLAGIRKMLLITQHLKE